MVECFERPADVLMNVCYYVYIMSGDLVGIGVTVPQKDLRWGMAHASVSPIF